MKKYFLLAESSVLVCALTILISCKTTSKDTTSNDEKEIKAIYDRFSAAVKARDINATMSLYVPDQRLVAFDAFPPRQYNGFAAYRKDYENFFAAFPGPIKEEITDLHIIPSDELAFAYGIDKWDLTGNDGKPIEMVFRFTDLFQKINGKWLVTHEHLSFPVDPLTGMADFLSKP